MNLKFACLQGGYWMAYCSLFTFIVPLCQSYGYSELECGVISMVGTAVLALAQPLWGILCDRAKRVRPVFALGLALGAAASLLLPLGRNSMALMIISFSLTVMTTQSLMYIIDVWSIRLRNDGVALSYGITRGSGSMMYAITAAIYGSCLDRFGMGIMLPTFIGLSLILIGVSFTVKEPPAPQPVKGEKAGFAEAAKFLFRCPQYLLLLAAVFFTFFGSSGAMLFFPLKVKALGGGNGEYGLALFIMAMSEIPFLLIYRFLAKRFSNTALLVFSLFFMIAKVGAIALSTRLWMIIALQVAQGPAYGLYLSAVANYVPEIVPRRMVFTAQTIISAVISGLAGICSNYMIGYLTEKLSLQAGMNLMVCVTAMGFVIFGGGTAILRLSARGRKAE